MSVNDPRYESMVFNYETIMKQDYRDGEIKDIKKTVYKEKSMHLKVQPLKLKDTQTLTDWRNPNLHFELLVKPKEVVRTKPGKIQAPYVEIEDLDMERVRATRPRLVMSPAVSMDDIESEHKRKILIKEMYTSTKSTMEKGITLNGDQSSVKAPLSGTLSPANPIFIKKLQVEYVMPEWRMDSVSWDGRQLRSYCDLSKDFYLAQPLRCEVCAETAARELNKKKFKQVKQNV